MFVIGFEKRDKQLYRSEYSQKGGRGKLKIDDAVRRKKENGGQKQNTVEPNGSSIQTTE